MGRCVSHCFGRRYFSATSYVEVIVMIFLVLAGLGKVLENDSRCDVCDYTISYFSGTSMLSMRHDV